ncbi:NADH-quinone oxidoreductase subunit M [Leeia sp. TBRC 13508]|uniref:NADH-quinone oxidoreductase subunit M n=1 Tax=Leeia speluncae TaxID=2884804 RepID=A0ABS8D271_9NEIS|nr:NADH-quinone oxidoreductase subunit M [Leeia speluncae]MCB6182286.1 NADH-quinone oxidoreductase subunit M [Leeia speluncae]
MFEKHLLSLAVWLPILSGIAVIALGGGKRGSLARWIALAGSLLSFFVTLPLFTGFDSLNAGMQFVEDTVWIQQFNIHYALGVDGISLFFVILNSFTTFLVVLAGWQVIQSRVSHYYAAFLIMSGLINGSFAAMDAVLFYVFFEAMLIPMYLIIGIWGGPRRVYASVKFFLYTLLGSLLLLIAFIYLHNASGGSFAIADFQSLSISKDIQTLLFVAFFASFAVKVPMWPVHTWLPDAHVEAPTGGSMVLAAITLKIGAYGFLRFCLPIAPVASHDLSWIIIAFSLVAVVYIGMVALVQSDMKKLIAYSSISHMGFVTLGFFMFKEGHLNAYAVEGALLQMISHGFVSAAMFFCVGVMYDRVHSRQIADYGGVVNTMPIFASFFLLFAMANAGLPATSGFVGEFLVIMGATSVNFWIAFLAASTLIFGAAYTLWMYKRVVFGAVANDHVAELTDVNGRELLVLVILAVTVLGMGLYPDLFAQKMHASVNNLITLVADKQAAAAALGQ